MALSLRPEDLRPERWLAHVLPAVVQGTALDWSEVGEANPSDLEALFHPLKVLGLPPETLVHRLGLATMPPELRAWAVRFFSLDPVQLKEQEEVRDPFAQLEAIQTGFRNYAESFVGPRNPAIREFIRKGIKEEDLLWREPFVAQKRRYRLGKSLDDLIREGLLPPEARPLLRRNPEDFQDLTPIHPYVHQEEALRAALRGESFVVATGTGSGKSLAFGLPILAYALEERRPGIKAVLVYPMNALANSQYRDFALRLHGSGLRIALYNGETPHTRKDGEALRQKLLQERPVSDAEVLSREEIRENPPDILLTNYVQLELLLTRGEDRFLFPPEHRGVLRYLVLDEVHTYAGLRGADVAFLIRRLCQHTGTTESLQVIGTSATVDRGEEAIRRFAENLFGSPVARVIGETLEDPPPLDLKALPPELKEALEAAPGGEARVRRALLFVEGLLKEPKTLSELAQAWAKEAKVPEEEARKEVVLALRVGAATGYLAPRIHAFYAQAPDLTATLDLEALSLKGERHLQGKPAYPVVFCRNCGQEYLVARAKNGHYLPGPSLLDPMGPEVRYLRPGAWLPQEEPLPEDWLEESGEPKKGRRSLLPTNLALDPYTGAPQEGGVPVAVLPYPFQYCPTCQVAHSRRGGEIRKLTAFGLVGRSTATDLLLLNTLSTLPPKERKIIVFSDNRQDTEFQAGHFQDLFRKALFRQTVLELLEGGPAYLSQVGRQVYEAWARADAREEVHPLYDPYSPEGAAYLHLLSLAAVLEAVRNTQPNLKNLEAAGLVRYRYRHLEEVAKDPDLWEGLAVPEEVRRDYLTGLLDLIRRRGAIRHDLFNPSRFRLEVEEPLATLPHEVFVEPLGAALVLEVPTPSNPRFGHTFLLHGTRRPSLFEAWTMRALGLPWEEARALLKKAVKRLKEKAVLMPWEFPAWGRGKVEGVALNHNAILLEKTEGEYLVCPRSGYTGPLHALQISPEFPGQPLEKRRVHPFYEHLYRRRAFATPLEARAHSAQVSGEERRRLEERFRNPQDPLSVLVATPTLEMGIDIGALSSVFLRNIPPSPANYAQRSGRAGRKGQPALIQAFAGSLGHDQYFYRFPEKMVRGTIQAPRFLLDNPRLAQAHVRALVLEVLAQKGFSLPAKVSQAVDYEDQARFYPLRASFAQDLAQLLAHHREEVLQAVREAFAREMARFPWFSEDFLQETVGGFPQALDRELNPWREEYQDAQARYTEYANRLRHMGPHHPHKDEVQAEMERADRQRKHLVDLDLRGYLAGRGFLPNYAFGRATTWVELLTPGGEVERLERPTFIALTEFAPGNTLYYGARRYHLDRLAFLPKEEDLRLAKRCTCGHVEALGPRCRWCHKDLSGEVPTVRLLPPPVLMGTPRRRISSEEEDRARLGYEVEWDWRPKNPKAFRSGAYRLLYEHNAEVVAMNKGLRSWLLEEEENPLQEGFVYCRKCRRFLLTEKELQEHPWREGREGRCPAGGQEGDLRKGVVLEARAESDVLALEVPAPPGLDPQRIPAFYKSLLAAFRKAALVVLELADDELWGFLQPTPQREVPYRVVLAEGQEGGLGALAALATWPSQETPHPLQELATTALRLMHEGEEAACERACYECLMDYGNQGDHPLLDRTLVMPVFALLQEAHFQAEEEEDLPPHLIELLNRCESELEKRWVLECYRRGLPLPDQAQYTLDLGGTHTRLDFYYARGVGVYVDGPHHQDPGQAQKDGEIRRRLTLMGFPFVVFREGEAWDPGFQELEALLGPQESLAWDEALELVDPAYRPLLEALRRLGLRPPDEVGEDLLEEGRVVGISLARWGKLRLVPPGFGEFGLEVMPKTDPETVRAYLEKRS
ncbi:MULTISPECIES: DEAD/DEAH box helicase [unclassified Meiothermus]|uniref:DEAD/DEAH box helicase n=1 Tax=unclassified Meiothermus TaxID=370471 RepID=UPI000D7D057D|nr:MULTISPECIES: DEAD/DEAH box helicase [unclassified Meiothermus]PZA06048.1 helicase with metal-binding cysteine cluster [Meiothermus sp. Pnk-1]RYM36156.1 DEAD/DEAH box helicase [Meiothermus sp. PNK-Is4]